MGARLARGTSGPVFTKELDPGSRKHGERRPAVWQARARICLLDGEQVMIERRSSTKQGAQKRLGDAISARLDREAQEVGSRALVTLRASAEQWLLDLADDHGLAPKTRQVYRDVVGKHVLSHRLARKPIAAITAGQLEDLLRSIGRPGAAKTCRTALSRIFARAARHGQIPRNIVRDMETVRLRPQASPREHDRALTNEEAITLLLTAYRGPRWRAPGPGNPRGTDLADLLAFMLSTGLRIGEAAAVRPADVDLENMQLRISGNITRIRGQGLVRSATKTKSSIRTLPIHPRTAALVRRRLRARGPLSAHDLVGPLFPSAAGTWRDPSNTAKLVDTLMTLAGLPWATSHTLRRTVLTRLGDRGVPLRLIADLAGHANPSMTARIYLGRRGVDDQLRAAL